MGVQIATEGDVNITKVGHFGGSTYAVEVSGNYAYSGQGSDFVVLDISNKTAPAEVGKVETSGIIIDIALEGNYAYVADGENGLVIVDVTNPAAPTLKGSCDTAGHSLGVAVEGNYAYVADGNNGLVIFRVDTSSYGTVHNINKGTNYTTIQAAINDSNPGDEIHVDSGTYYENVNVSKRLILRGVDTGGGMPVVDAGGSGNAITLSASGSTLDGFVVTNATRDGYRYYDAGIRVVSNNNIVENNKASNNHYSIYLYYSSNNMIIDNTASSNNKQGIYLYFSSNNKIYHNNLINNSNPVYDNTCTNSWNATYPSGGNYWSDYTGADNFSGADQTLSGSDGIGDTPYSISGGAGAQDRYPFMRENGWLQETVRGDLNRNGRRDTGDATLMLRTIVELPIPSQYQPVLPVGDMNCNNRLDTGDATLVLRDVVGLPIPRCWE